MAANPALTQARALQLWGLVWGGPSAHFWMGFMQRLSPKTDMATVLTKARTRLLPLHA